MIMINFAFLSSVLLFAVSNDIGLEDLPAESWRNVIVVVAVCVTIGVVAHLVQSVKRRNTQRKIDESNRLYYNRWHHQVATTGTIAPVQSPLVLKDGEECLRVECNVTLFEVRAVRRSTHTFGTMPLGNSRIRIGRGYSTSESTDEWRPIAEGRLYVTNKRIYFDGDKQDRKIPLDKIATLKADWSAIEVSSETREKSMIFAGVNGRVCQEIVHCALGRNIFGGAE